MEGNHWELMKLQCLNICDVQGCHMWYYQATAITGIGDPHYTSVIASFSTTIHEYYWETPDDTRTNSNKQ